MASNQFLNIDGTVTPEGRYQHHVSFLTTTQDRTAYGEGKEFEPSALVELLGSTGEVLLRYPVPVAPVCVHPAAGVEAPARPLFGVSGQVPYQDGTRTVRIRLQGEPVLQLEVPRSAPQVRWTMEPRKTEGRALLAWSVESKANVRLQHMVYLDRKGSRLRLPVSSWITAEELDVDLDSLPGGDMAFLLVTTDGVNTVERRGRNFRRPNQPPHVTILSPADESVVPRDLPVSFLGAAYDRDLDYEPLRSMEWRSSRDGVLAHGPSFEAFLSPGRHKITLAGRLDDREASTDITLMVRQRPE